MICSGLIEFYNKLVQSVKPVFVVDFDVKFSVMHLSFLIFGLKLKCETLTWLGDLVIVVVPRMLQTLFVHWKT